MSTKNTILTVGSLAFDTIETPTGKVEMALGGSGNYFSVAASFFAPVSVVGVVGDDFPQSHLQWMKMRKIDTSGVETAKGKTFHWVGQYDRNLNEAKTLSTFLNVFEHFNPKLNDHHKDSPYVFLANIDPVLQLSILRQVHKTRIVACDSMNFWITGKLPELRETLKKVDILSINEGEATLLSGQKNLLTTMEAIREMGPSVVIVKRGEYGAVLHTGRSLYLAPAFPVQSVIDPTGAGDSFAGAFMGFLAESGADREMETQDPKKWDQILRKAVLAGCVMASFTVEDFSLHRLMRLNRGELIARQDELIRMVQI